MAFSDFPKHHPQWGEMIAWDPVRKRAMYGKWNWETNDEDLTVVTDVDDGLMQNHFDRMESQNSTVIGKQEHAFDRKIASIPMQLLYDEKLGLNKALQEGDKYADRWLNSSDNYKFRTNESKV